MFVSLSLSRTLFISPSPSVSFCARASHIGDSSHTVAEVGGIACQRDSERPLGFFFILSFFFFVHGTSPRIERKEERPRRASLDYLMSCACCGSNHDYSVPMDEVLLSIDRGQFVRLGRETFPRCFCNADFYQFSCYNWVVATGILRESSFDRQEPESFYEETLKVK